MQSQNKDVVSYEEFIEDGDESYVWPELDENAPCGLCYTSGTTEIKGVLYSQSQRYFTLGLARLQTV